MGVVFLKKNPKIKNSVFNLYETIINNNTNFAYKLRSTKHL